MAAHDLLPSLVDGDEAVGVDVTPPLGRVLNVGDKVPPPEFEHRSTHKRNFLAQNWWARRSRVVRHSLGRSTRLQERGSQQKVTKLSARSERYRF
jgi:hypothetical protein